jgi:hypothetical protein
MTATPWLLFRYSAMPVAVVLIKFRRNTSWISKCTRKLSFANIADVFSWIAISPEQPKKNNKIFNCLKGV